jgi:hypothetical protein
MIEMLEGARPGGVASFEQPRTAEVAMDRRRKDILRSLANLRTRSTGHNAYQGRRQVPRGQPRRDDRPRAAPR